MKKFFKAQVFMAKLLFQLSKRKTICCVFLFVVVKLLPVASAKIIQILYDFYLGLSVELLPQIVYLLLLLMITEVMISALNEVLSMLTELVTSDIANELDKKVMKKVSELDCAYFDMSENLDNIEIAEDSEIYVCENLFWCISFVASCISLITIGFMLFMNGSPLYLLLLFIYLPGAYFQYKAQKNLDQWSLDNVPSSRRKDYYTELLTRKEYAEELRLYNLQSYFKRKLSDLWIQIRKERGEIFRQGTTKVFLFTMVEFSINVLLTVYIIIQTIHGSISIGTMPMLLTLFKCGGDALQDCVRQFISEYSIVIPRIEKFVCFFESDNDFIERSTGKIKIEKIENIRFIDVCFKYPENDSYTLKNCSFDIECNEKIALVGENGAGKTTIVKLLLRLYDVDTGSIMINGTNIKEIEIQSLHKALAVCFQETSIYKLSVEENIALGDILRVEDSDALVEAAKGAGIDGMIDSIPNKYKTNVGLDFDEAGIELSGGQAQKMAIARVLFKKSSFLILDEPSSSLDPEAEHHMIQSLEKICEGKGCLLITHRLSCIYFVDKILVLQDGKIYEQGNHEQLMKSRGLYYKMYSYQAAQFREGFDNSEKDY